jgi:biopolymer transport protein ExbD
MQVPGSRVSAQINVTPMIDILLVLLIVFMVIPTNTKGLKSEVPQPPSEQQAALPEPLSIVINIRKDRTIELNSHPIEIASLRNRLESVFASRPDGVLFVQGAPELEFGDVASVIDAAHGAGIHRVALMTARE